MLGITNTRMKEYFDLWVLLVDSTLDPAEILSRDRSNF